MVSRPQQMSAHSKEILHDAVHGREPLHVSGRLEAPHLSFALPRRLMGNFGAIVRVLVRRVDHGRHHSPMSSRITAQLVHNHTARDGALAFQQLPKEAPGGAPITPGLHEDVDHVAVFVDRLCLPKTSSAGSSADRRPPRVSVRIAPLRSLDVYGWLVSVRRTSDHRVAVDGLLTPAGRVVVRPRGDGSCGGRWCMNRN